MKMVAIFKKKTGEIGGRKANVLLSSTPWIRLCPPPLHLRTSTSQDRFSNVMLCFPGMVLSRDWSRVSELVAYHTLSPQTEASSHLPPHAENNVR